MKKYKIGNRIITADSIISAVKISKMLDSTVVKASMKDEYFKYRGASIYKHPSKELYMIEGFGETYSSLQEAKKAIDKDISHGIRYDSDNSEIEYLTEEEERAVEDYRKAIAGTTNSKLLELYKHILDEELEHIQELQEADVEDSVKDWAPPYAIWVKKDGKWIIFGGANSTNVDKRRFLNSGYEDVVVVENGKEPTQDCDMKDERLSPMTYKKLKELGVTSKQWSGWTQEQANEYIRNKSQKGSKTSEKKEANESGKKSNV